MAVIACSENSDHFAALHTATCQLAFCPDCARRDANRLCEIYLPRVRQVVKENKRSEYRLRRVTLTRSLSLWDTDITDQMDRAWTDVNTLFDVLCGDPAWSEPAHPCYTDEFYIASSEFGESGNKLHFHVLFFGRWIDQQRLSDLWKSINSTGDYIVDIRAGGSTVKNLKETLKYVAKFTKSYALRDGEKVALLPDPRFIARLAQVLHGTRRVRTRGSIRTVTEELTEVSDGVIEELCPECGAALVSWLPNYWQSLHAESDLDLLHLKRVDNFRNWHGGSIRAPPEKIAND